MKNFLWNVGPFLLVIWWGLSGAAVVAGASMVRMSFIQTKTIGLGGLIVLFIGAASLLVSWHVWDNLYKGE